MAAKSGTEAASPRRIRHSKPAVAKLLPPTETPSEVFFSTFLVKRNISRAVFSLGLGPPDINFDGSILDKPVVVRQGEPKDLPQADKAVPKVDAPPKKGIAKLGKAVVGAVGNDGFCARERHLTALIANLFVKADDTDYPTMKIHQATTADYQAVYKPEIDELYEAGHIRSKDGHSSAVDGRRLARAKCCHASTQRTYIPVAAKPPEAAYNSAMTPPLSSTTKSILLLEHQTIRRLLPLLHPLLVTESDDNNRFELFAKRKFFSKEQKTLRPPSPPFFPDLVISSIVPLSPATVAPPEPLVLYYQTTRLLLAPGSANCLFPVTYVGNEGCKDQAVRRVRFQLDDGVQLLGVPPGQFFLLTVPWGDGFLTQPAFPVGACDLHGFFEILWRDSGESASPYRVPKFANALRQILPNSQTVTVRGPFGSFFYRGDGWITHPSSLSSTLKITKRYPHIAMIGMTFGVLPFLTILDQASRERALQTDFTLLQIGFQTSDLWMTVELEQITSVAPNICKCHKIFLKFNMYSQVHEKLENFLSKFFPVPGKDTLIVICAPPAFVANYLIPALTGAGFVDKECLYGYDGLPSDLANQFQCDSILL